MCGRFVFDCHPALWKFLGTGRRWASTSLLALFVRVITVVNAMYSAQHLAHQFSGGCTVSIVCNAWVASPRLRDALINEMQQTVLKVLLCAPESHAARPKHELYRVQGSHHTVANRGKYSTVNDRKCAYNTEQLSSSVISFVGRAPIIHIWVGRNTHANTRRIPLCPPLSHPQSSLQDEQTFCSYPHVANLPYCRLVLVLVLQLPTNDR